MKKGKMRVMAVIVLSAMVLCCACGKKDAAGGGTIEGELSDIMADIYAGVNVDAETKEAMQGYVRRFRRFLYGRRLFRTDDLIHCLPVCAAACFA